VECEREEGVRVGCRCVKITFSDVKETGLIGAVEMAGVGLAGIMSALAGADTVGNCKIHLDMN